MGCSAISGNILEVQLEVKANDPVENIPGESWDEGQLRRMLE